MQREFDTSRETNTKESTILFTFLRVMGLFFRSKAPGLVFSVTYPWGSFAPSAFPR